MKDIFVMTLFVLATLAWAAAQQPGSAPGGGQWADHVPEFAGAGHNSNAALNARRSWPGRVPGAGGECTYHRGLPRWQRSELHNQGQNWHHL